MQWLAPLASEAPELLVAGLYAWRLNTNAGLGTLVSLEGEPVDAARRHAADRVRDRRRRAARAADRRASSARSCSSRPRSRSSRSPSCRASRCRCARRGCCSRLFWAQFILGGIVPGAVPRRSNASAWASSTSCLGRLGARDATGRSVPQLVRDGFRAPYDELAGHREADEARRGARRQAERPVGPPPVALPPWTPGVPAAARPPTPTAPSPSCTCASCRPGRPTLEPFPDDLPELLVSRLGLTGVRGLYPHQSDGLAVAARRAATS